jgi:hypothetical protein
MKTPREFAGRQTTLRATLEGITLSVRAFEEDQHSFACREKALLRTTAGNDCRFLPTGQSESFSFFVEATFVVLVHSKKDSSYHF